MGSELFDVVFCGHIREGADPEKVKVRLGAMFRTDGKRLERLFSGKRFVIKREVDEATAQKYQDALRKAGAECEIQSVSEKTIQSAARPATPSPVAREQPPGSERGAGGKTEVTGAQRSELHVASAEPQAPTAWQPLVSVMRLVGRFWGRALGLAVVLFIVIFFAQVREQREMKARVDYALEQTSALRIALAQFMLKRGRLPAGSAELGKGARQDYPDGGYYYLADDGYLVIQFTVVPELAAGTIHVTPRLIAGAKGIDWVCSSKGSIPNRFLPAMCREN